MLYVICDSSKGKYLTVNSTGISVTTNIEKATKWKVAESAQNLLLSLKKAKKTKIHQLFNYKIKSIEEKTVSLEETKQKSQEVSLPVVSIVSKNKESIVVCENIEQSVEKKLTDILHFIEGLNVKQKDLEAKQSVIDLELTDILHKIELSPNMNACQGYQMYKAIREITQHRRKIKNELELVKYIMDQEFDFSDTQKIKSKLHSIHNRKYVPRIHNELF